MLSPVFADFCFSNFKRFKGILCLACVPRKKLLVKSIQSWLWLNSGLRHQNFACWMSWAQSWSVETQWRVALTGSRPNVSTVFCCRWDPMTTASHSYRLSLQHPHKCLYERLLTWLRIGKQCGLSCQCPQWLSRHWNAQKSWRSLRHQTVAPETIQRISQVVGLHFWAPLKSQKIDVNFWTSRNKLFVVPIKCQRKSS